MTGELRIVLVGLRIVIVELRIVMVELRIVIVGQARTGFCNQSWPKPAQVDRSQPRPA